MLKKLLEPVKAGRLTLKNRIMFPPLTTGYEERDGSIGERSLNFYERLAKGGTGYIVIGDVAPVRTASPTPKLYVGPSQFYCMLGEHKQASPDTICSMIYDERLLDYWKINPDRYPDVVVFESCYGDIAQEGENSFIWNWLMEDFKPAERKDYPYITVFMR